MSAAQNRQYILAARPRGLPTAQDVPMREIEVPRAGEGEIVVRNLYMSLDPAIRGWMSDEPNYIPPIPVGTKVWATTVGRVVESRSPLFSVGDIALAMSAWEDYSLLPAAAATNLGNAPPFPLSYYLGVLGPTGLTAYFGLLDVGQPKASETLLVSGAAGAVGSIVGQIGKILGLRVIGIAGGAEKCRQVMEEFQFDDAIDYKSCGDLTAAIRAKCPQGVDIYWENVGGEMLDAVLLNLAERARIVFCGWIATYNDREKRAGPKNLWQLLARSARMEGFVVKDYLDRAGEGIGKLAGWMAEGKIHHREHVVDGLENALSAFHMLFDGRNTGKLVVHIAD